MLSCNDRLGGPLASLRRDCYKEVITMSDFQIISKNNENFVVDWDVIERLLKSIYTTQYQLINSTINPMKPSGEFHLHEEVL
jgi:hypothetical protein